MNGKSNNQIKRNRLDIILKIILLSLVVLFLITAYFIMLDWGSPFFIALLVDLFLFLFFTGLIFKPREKSLISRIFPMKDKEIKIKISSNEEDTQEERAISLEFKYHKSLIKKCPNCGMILTSTMNKCPNCGRKIKRY
jgi:hypothetical protein